MSYTCKRCGKTFDGFPAISRRDNASEICPDCGKAEAFAMWAAYQAGHDQTEPTPSTEPEGGGG